jgi:fructose/tagatose bisphosphate aldolase
MWQKPKSDRNCPSVGVSVEAELGTIGQTSEYGEKISGSGLTEPEDARNLWPKPALIS